MRSGCVVYLQQGKPNLIYRPEDVIWLAQYDPVQQVYGQPDYLGGLQSALLNQDATMFRRKYFLNGAHMGFIFYATDPNMDDDTEEEMKEMIASSKGVGNFRSMFVNIPDGKPDGIKLIPVGDIATKDEFAAIKGITAQDVLTSHRFPAALAGIIFVVSVAYCSLLIGAGNLARRHLIQHPRISTVLRRVAGYNLDIFRNQNERPYTADGSVNLAHLLVGSEGTLALIVEASLRLTPAPSARRALRAIYRDVGSAAQAVSGEEGEPAGKPSAERTGGELPNPADAYPEQGPPDGSHARGTDQA